MIYGDIEALTHHMNGIDRLVAIRGGSLDNFDYGDIVRYVIPWCDHYRALFTHTAPSYPVSPSPYNHEYTTYNNSPMPSTLSPNLSPILANIRQLTSLRSRSLQGHTPSTLDVQHYMSQRDYLEHELTFLASQPPSSSLDRVLILASLLYITLFLRLQNPKYAIVGYLAAGMAAALPLPDEEADETDLLLWSLFLGASIDDSQFGELRALFVWRIREFMEAGWEEVWRKLEGVVWPAEMMDKAKGVWMEAMALGV